MPAAITDKFNQATNGTRPVPTTLTATRAIGASSITVGALTGWPTATAVHFSIYQVDTSGNKVAGSQTDWKGTASGTTISNLTLEAGSDSGDSVGAIVECGPTAAWANDVVDGILVDHDQSGQHKNLTDANGNEWIKQTATTSAVNEITVANAATGNGPVISATGGDTNIDGQLLGKGTGTFRFSGPYDGWNACNETLTYASATTFTCSAALAGVLSVGDKIKLTQTTAKYFYVTGVSGTTVTVTGGSDYSLANAAITLPFFSKEVSPTGFPDRFAFTPTWTSSGSAPSIGNGTFTGYFSMVGKKVYLRFKFVGGSTTTWGTGTYYITLPVTGYTGIAANDGFTLNGYAEDLSTVAYTVLGTRMDNTSRFYVLIYAPQTTSASSWAQTQPFTWGTGDYWSATGWYDAA